MMYKPCKGIGCDDPGKSILHDQAAARWQQPKKIRAIPSGKIMNERGYFQRL